MVDVDLARVTADCDRRKVPKKIVVYVESSERTNVTCAQDVLLADRRNIAKIKATETTRNQAA